jgi:hypothetical protein
MASEKRGKGGKIGKAAARQTAGEREGEIE